MATKNPRLQVLLEKPLYKAVAFLAEEEGVSMSTKARDLIREALERLEDVGLASDHLGRFEPKGHPCRAR